MTQEWLVDGGEMGRMIRAKDWAKTPLGAIDSWPQSLRTTVGLCLASNFPINLIWGPEHTQIFNDGYWPICGDKYQQVLGSNYRECWASAWSVLSEAFESAIQGRTSFLENQRMFLDRNGYLEETFFTFSLSPIRDETGHVSGLFHPVTETTSRMLAERRSKALRELSAQLAQAKTVEDVHRQSSVMLKTFELDIAFALIYEFNREGTQAVRVGQVGFTADAAVNPSRIKINDSGSAWPLKALARDGTSQTMNGLNIPACGPYPEPIRDACVLPLRSGAEPSSGALILGASPRLPFDSMASDFFEFVAATISTAMTNARAYEEEKRKAEDLAALDLAKTTFFSNISHEFRTPLTLMLVPLEELLNHSLKDLSHEVIGERLEVVHRNSLRLLKLVNNLLDFSRIEAGRSVARFQATALEQLTLDLISAFRSTAEVSGISIITEMQGAFEPVYVDRDLWEKIILNLLSNAFKYTLSGFIKIKMIQENGEVKVSVQDSGMGIAESDLPHLFERFYRVHESQGRSYEGSGIGLAMVLELVKLHGGQIAVESQVGSGSTFTVTIPLGKAHLPKDRIDIGESPIEISPHTSAMYLAEVQSLARSPSNAPSASASPTQREHILLIDDNNDMRETIRKLLADRYEVTCAADGLEGFELAERLHPDLILCDIMMPKLDGFGLVKKIRADQDLCPTPVILVSARAGEEAKVEGFDRGADDYLTKPFSSRELLARVAAHLTMARIRSQAETRERELLAEVEGAKRSNELKDEFLATVSHELRTPLNAILGFSQMLHSDSSQDSGYFDTAIDAIVRNAEHQCRIVNDLLDMSRMITGKLRLECRDVLISDVVEAAMESVSLSAKAKHIEIVWNPPRQTPRLKGDPGRLQQVLWNLLANAIRFSPQHSQITISLTLVDGMMNLSVKDQGEGMAPEFLPFAFDALRQENGSLTRTHGGLGLGLKIVKHIVDAHGGTASITSEGKGRGTEVTIALPVLPEPEVKPRPLQGVSILTVDDDKDAQLMVKILLNRAGADVETASSAAEAWDMLAEKKTDILLSDIGMPLENGYEFLKRLRAQPGLGTNKTIPAIALTAWAREEDKRLAYEAGFQEHLAKPIKSQILIDTVARLVGRIHA